METIKQLGKVYQVGMRYKSFVCKRVGYLIGHNGSDFSLSNFPDTSGHQFFARKIEEVGVCGTIEDAPIELEDGEWYMCADDNGLMRAAYYDGSTLTGGVNSSGDSCLHLIRKNEYRVLYKMVKAEG
tara:strand:- start:55 stop:435 length:381 start_codon:yes stop_codon:yes gene_type:complete